MACCFFDSLCPCDHLCVAAAAPLATAARQATVGEAEEWLNELAALQRRGACAWRPRLSWHPRCACGEPGAGVRPFHLPLSVRTLPPLAQPATRAAHPRPTLATMR